MVLSTLLELLKVQRLARPLCYTFSEISGFLLYSLWEPHPGKGEDGKAEDDHSYYLRVKYVNACSLYHYASHCAHEQVSRCSKHLSQDEANCGF